MVVVLGFLQWVVAVTVVLVVVLVCAFLVVWFVFFFSFFSSNGGGRLQGLVAMDVGYDQSYGNTVVVVE